MSSPEDFSSKDTELEEDDSSSGGRSIHQDVTIRSSNGNVPKPVLPGSELSETDTFYQLDDLMGRVIDGRYEIDELVGKGAMGAVFRARQLRLRRTVAIKVPRPDIIEKKDYRGRFEREALTMAKLVHQNIVQIFDVFISREQDDPSFIAMEYVEGEHFGNFLIEQSSSLTVSAILTILDQVAQGLDAAHAHGVIHRDIKPSNIMITLPQRVPKIMDFGIAKVDMDDAFQTMNLETLGTPAYMAPEQVTGDEISERTDIYSFGVMAYCIFVGRFPHDVNRLDIRKVMQAHVSSPIVPASKQNPNLPRSIDKLFESILSRDVTKRPVSAVRFIANLREGLKKLEDKPMSFVCDPERKFDDGMESAAWTPVQGSISKGVLISVLAGVVFILLAIAGIIAIRGDGSNDGANGDEMLVAETTTQQITDELPVLEDQDIDPVSTPVDSESPDEEIIPTPSPVPVSSPIPTPVPTPEPEPVVIVPEVEPEQVIPVPSPTPVPTPVPEKKALPDNPTNPPVDRGRELTNPADYRFEKSTFEKMINERIEKPVYYSQFGKDDNALTTMDGSYPSVLVDELQMHAKTYRDLNLIIEVQDSSLYWEKYAELDLIIALKGNPKNNPNRNFKKDISLDTGKKKLIMARNSEDNWEFISLD